MTCAHTHAHKNTPRCSLLCIIHIYCCIFKTCCMTCFIFQKCCLFHDFIFFCSNKMYFFLINHALKYKHQPRHSNVNKCQDTCQCTIFTANTKINPICPQTPPCNSSIKTEIKAYFLKTVIDAYI